MMLLANLWTHVRHGIRRDDGATMVEYGLMVALIAIVALLAVTALGVSVRDIFQSIADTLGGGGGGGGGS